MTAAGRAYFRYHFCSKWKLLLFLVVVSMILTAVDCVDGQKFTHTYFFRGVEEHLVIYDSTIEGLFIILVASGCLLPISEFNFFKKRRNLDCVYGLPITRREMGVIHYITGLICMIIPYTCAYLVNFLFMLRYPEGFYYPPVLGYYFISILIGICAYSINVFVFNQANTTVDGICFMLGWTFLLSLLAGVWNAIVYTIIDDIEHEILLDTDTTMGYHWGALYQIRYFYVDVIEKKEEASLNEMWGNREYVTWFIWWIVLGVASVVGFVCSFGKRRTEKTGEITDSWFGFKLLIPVYAVGYSFSGVGALVSTILAFVGYVFYRRGFRLKKSDWILLAVVCLLSIVCSVIFADTLFGM